jgi:hypothetical protein
MPMIFKTLSPEQKSIVKSALKNGILWSVILLGITYFRNDRLNWEFFPLWFLFFAGTGAFRTIYLNRKKN